MASPYVLGNESLQYTASTIGTRFRLYFAAFDPISVIVQSQDIQLDDYGQYINPPNVDLLADHKAPYAPQPNFGPNRIAFAGESLFFDGSRSTQRGNLPASSYTWSVKGPSATLTTYHHPYAGANAQCSIQFNKPGLYTVSLTVKDRFGGSTTGKRQVMVYADRESTPRGVISVDNITGDISSGGWSGSVTIARNAVNVLIPDALPIGSFQPVVIMAETEYEIAPGVWKPINIGPYAAPIPGQYYNDPRILFFGYIQQGSGDQTDSTDTVALQLSGPQMILQQAGIHNIGYYSTTYKTRDSHGIPTSLNSSKLGKGQLVADLTSEDLYRSLLLDHCNFGLYHDVVIWRDMLTMPHLTPWTPNSSYVKEAGPKTADAVYYMTYSTLTANEGMIWDAITTMAQNEFADVWCDQRGAFLVGPTINMRGYELIKQPTSYGPVFLGEVLNYKSELASNNTLASSAAYLNFLFGGNAIPQPLESTTGVARDLSKLVGPPILCHFSDIPRYDTDSLAPDDPNLFPWVTANWPQDIAVHPTHTVVTENYSTRTDFVKMVATLVTGSTVWSAWYPTDTFSSKGIMRSATYAGQWDVETSMLLPDATIATDGTAKARSWQYLWEMARRRRLALNTIYSVQIDGGMWPWISLHDLFYYTRQRPQTGPQFSGMLYYTQSISHTINMAEETWQTVVNGSQVTVQGIGPMITPPFDPPKNNS